MGQLLQTLRAAMAQWGMDAYLLPTDDFHGSEYVGDYFKLRQAYSGFTGSAGTLLVLADWAGLWTDGRYFIQAQAQLTGSGIELCRMGEAGVPTLEEAVGQRVPQGGVLAFDGRVVSASLGRRLAEQLRFKGGRVLCNQDLAGGLWTGRPPLSCAPAFLLPERYSGRSTRDKLKDVRAAMEQAGAQVHLLTSLNDIAYLFNLRGGDVAYNPVVLAYAAVTREEARLFLNGRVLSPQVRAALEADGVTLCPYDGVYAYAAALRDTQALLDCQKVNYALVQALDASVRVVDRPNPTTLQKAVKNSVEIENIKRAHCKDGAAFVRFMRWVKENVGRTPLTERSAQDYLEQRRKEQDGYLEPSFATICAYEEHAAMMHYAATEASDAALKARGLLLVDSGGQYYEGTTDITRTLALGPLDAERKRHFTAVLRSMLALQRAKFLHGCTGRNLDILARGPIWDMGLDYQCGTGHGVGYLLGVHEEPNGFRWRQVSERNDGAVLEPGMVTTDEPGVYLEGRYGIRTENELLCVEAERNGYGQFLAFEPVTYAPIDLDAIEPSQMSPLEREQLNAYHALVYEKLAPQLQSGEREWLKQATRPI